jgi:multidrug efflux pump subunit AcrB
MRKLSHFFVTNPKLTVVVMGFLIIFGVVSLRAMNSESFPSVDFATAIIETEYFGATPEDIEVKITKPLEDEIRAVSGLKDVRSVSQAGRSKIVVRVDMDNRKVVVKDVMTDLQKAIDRAQNLPTDLRDNPKFTELKSEEFAAIEIAVIGSNQNRQRDLVADALKEDIEDNKNVKAVVPEGYREREFEIELSRRKLDEFHIGVDEVLHKIRARNVNIPGGELEHSGLQQLVKVEGKIRSAEELGLIPIRSTFTGQMVRLKDVARVIDGQEKPRVLTRYMGEEASLLTVQKKGGADTLKLVDSIRPLLERYRTKHPELKFVVFNDEGIRVENKLATLSSNALIGLVVVLTVLLFFMPGRVGVVVAMSLPISLLATLGLMPAFGLTLNSITVLALIIAMGMLVDNSVVISEEYLRRRRMGLRSVEAAVQTVTIMWIPITATAFTTIAAFLPMLVTTGIMGRFIYAIPVVVTTALLFCLLECFLLLPMRLHLVAGNMDVGTVEAKKTSWFDKVAAPFEKLMGYIIDHRYLMALVITGIIIFSGVMIGVFNKFMLFPAEQTEIYLARMELPENTKVERTHELTQQLEKKIQETLGPQLMQHSVSFAGNSQLNPADPRGQFGQNVGLVRIYATPYAKNNVYYQDFLARLRGIQIPEATRLVFEEQVNGPPVGAPVSVTLRSNDGVALDAMVGKLMTDLKEINGVFDTKVDEVYGPEEVKVQLDYDKLDRLGLTTESVGNTIRTALTGAFVSNVTLNNKLAQLKVSFGDISRRNQEDLGQIKIMDARGNLVPLSLMASFETTRGSPQVKRMDYKRAKTLTASVDSNVITSVVANQAVANSFARHSADHPEVNMVFGGEQESTNESLASLGNAMILALIGIFGIMVYIFRSYLAPGLIMSTIPLGLLGVSVSFWAHGRPISFLAMIGVIGLAGIIVNNGIILIDFINQMRAEGKMPLRDILIKAPTIRLKPVMATSLTTMGGLFPTAYGLGGADAMLVPMTMSMAWGLTTGTILTLVWIPAGYAIIEDSMKLLAKIPFIANRMRERDPLTPEPDVGGQEAT